jgi:predicted transcriptional regulator
MKKSLIIGTADKKIFKQRRREMTKTETIFKIYSPAADLRTEADTQMEQRILASIYPLVKDVNDSPLNVTIVTKAVQEEEHLVLPVFDNLIKNGFLVKKYDFTSNVYKLTPQGLQIVQQAFVQQQTQSNSLQEQ